MARRRLQGDGVELAVLEEGEGRPVLMLHGFPDSGELWRGQVPALVEAGFRVGRSPGWSRTGSSAWSRCPSGTRTPAASGRWRAARRPGTRCCSTVRGRGRGAAGARRLGAVPRVDAGASGAGAALSPGARGGEAARWRAAGNGPTRAGVLRWDMPDRRDHRIILALLATAG